MKITSMRTCHRTEPVGVFMDAPVFSWVTEDTKAKKQDSARVRVFEGNKTVFDSGVQKDISSLAYKADMSLKPRTRYGWQVSVTADNGETAESPVAYFETGIMDGVINGKWIASPFEKSKHSILVKRFTLPAKPVKARAYIIGLGLYELNVNGKKATDEVLLPFCNDYGTWLQAVTMDVTDKLTAGENKLDVWMGKGWYMGRFGFGKDRCCVWGDQMKLLMELVVELEDGSVITVSTDESWQAAVSPIIESGIYNGEYYDARLEGDEEKNDLPFCVPAEAPLGRVMDRVSPPLRVCDTLPAPTLIVTPKGEQVLDFGQNTTGWIEFDCDVPAGEKVVLSSSEIMQDGCFYRENLRSAEARYEYTSKGVPAHVCPRFTFFGFRYVKVEGIEKVNPAAFTARVIHSDLPVTGHIETSNPKVNQLIHNAFWGQIGNFVDVPTDCPQRDERMGWTGDAHVFAPTASFNMGTFPFYQKYLYDMLEEQKQVWGSVPHVVPYLNLRNSVAEGKSTEDSGSHGACAWSDAATGISWTLYTFFGDKDQLARNYENMKLWTEWIYRQDERNCGGRRLWLCGKHFADWLALDNPDKDSAYGGTDPYYVASFYYYYSVDLTCKAAEVLGYTEDIERYRKLRTEIKDAFQNEFFTPTGRIAEPTQTAMLLALALNLVPEGKEERIKNDLKKKIEQRKMHLDTGFVGTYYLCRVLTENGMGDIAYTLLLNEDLPSWLYEVNMGATTVWERWNSVMPDGHLSSTGMNSLNHYAYGSVVEWMYRCMCGLNPTEEAPGFKKVTFAPVSDPRFDYANASYDSAAGRYEFGWKKEGESVTYHITVPFDCEAEYVPEKESYTVNGEKKSGKCTLTAGVYEIKA